MTKIEEIHDCKKCHGKIVCIETDKLGNTYCGYCHKKVDYSKLDNQDFKKFVKRLKEEKRIRR